MELSTQGGSFYIQERYMDILLLVAGLTGWQVWVSRCKESFTVQSGLMLFLCYKESLKGFKGRQTRVKKLEAISF